jgi:pilus assembly protein CpaE
LERLAHARDKARERRNRSGKTVAFVSAKGGCGATTVACHVARELPRRVDGKVLLADLDLQAGIVGLLTKTTSPYSVADAVNNLQRLDLSYWRGLISNGVPNLEILAAPAIPSAKELAAPELKQVLAFAGMQYDWIVVDLGRNLSGSTMSILDLVDETYLVTTPEVPALYHAKQMIQFLVDSGYGRSSLRLLLNRAQKRSEVTPKELEAMLGLPIYAIVVNDYQALQEAYAEGRLVDRSAALGESFERLAAKIAGVAEPEKKKKGSLFARVMGTANVGNPLTRAD